VCIIATGDMNQKAKAAKDIGATMILVPKEQGVEINLVPEQVCKDYFGLVYCETTYEPEVIDIGKEAGISVVEVETVEEALEYFLE